MMSLKQKWRTKDGSIKIMRIRSNISIDVTIRELEKYMDFLGISRQNWRMRTMSHGEGVGLAFVYDGVHYLITSEKQTIYTGTPSIEKNARAILHIIQNRVNEMRKGVETVESAFGGFVNLLSTPKLPQWMDEGFQDRGISIMLPPARKNQKQLEEE